MKVSVALITYNQVQFIRQAMESILMQKMSFPSEIVVGDDCSQDGTRDILEDYQKKHPDLIRLSPRESNHGMHRNFTRTISQCLGEYIVFLEGDDFWIHPEKLEKQVKFLDEFPECSICFHGVKKVYEDGIHPPEILGFLNGKPHFTLADLLDNNIIPTGSAMLRRNAIGEIPNWFYGLTMADWPLFVIAAQKGGIGYLQETMSAYRVHPGGVWNTLDPITDIRNRLGALKVFQSHLDPRYSKIIVKRQTILHYQLANHLIGGGRADQARPYVMSFIRGIRNLSPGTKTRALKLAANCFAPRTYKIISRFYARIRSAISPARV